MTPAGWETKQFAECFESISAPRTLQARDYLEVGSFPVISQNEGSILSGYWDDPADVLEIDRPVVIFGDHTRALKYIDFDFVVGAQGVKILRPRDGFVTKFLYYQLLSVPVEPLGYARHYRLISNRAMLRPPLEEQKRIVKILDAAFADIDEADELSSRSQAEAKELYAVAVGDIFEELGATSNRVRLGDFAERITKGSSPKWQGIKYVDEPEVLFVTSENVGSNKMMFERKKYVESIFNQKDAKSILARGDVLTNIVGASIGRTAVFELETTANINQAVCLIRCQLTELHNYFLAFLLNSRYFVNHLHDHEVNTARANLSLAFFRELKIPLPTMSKQLHVCEQLKALQDECRLLETSSDTKRGLLADLRQSLLHRAFSGQL